MREFVSRLKLITLKTLVVDARIFDGWVEGFISRCGADLVVSRVREKS